MFFRIMFCLGVAMLTSCSTAKMAMDPGLEVDSEKYEITERPTVFSGGDLMFGPYKATNISRGFINSSGSSTSIGKFKVGEKKKGQDYTYQFKGESSWNGACKVQEGNSGLGITSGRFNAGIASGLYADINCTFVPADSENTSTSAWNFSIKGERSVTATGTINVGSKTIKVAAVNKIEGSPLALGQHTGYYFYSGQSIIAGVDAISKEGPVWLNNKLSQDEKDTIGMVVVALLLNQVY